LCWWLLGLTWALAFGQDLENGERLAGLGGCASCHTEEGGPAYAGGYPIETSFGTFYGSNISPDSSTGIGDWSQDDFIRAMRYGRSPGGRPYAPAFPYGSFTGMTEADLADLFAYLMEQEPVEKLSREQEVPWLYRSRFGIGVWRVSGWKKGPYKPDEGRSEIWNRGAYLANAVGHCGECHTPRGSMGVRKKREHLAGSAAPPEPSPNITPHPDALGGWSPSDWSTFLELGMLPDGDFVGGHMGDLIEHGTATLSEADRSALVEYLRSVTPRP
jgi:mono/diheme cytochrome c family protein